MKYMSFLETRELEIFSFWQYKFPPEEDLAISWMPPSYKNSLAVPQFSISKTKEPVSEI
jgi:hypothetical protein